jgi:hypothetical protein
LANSTYYITCSLICKIFVILLCQCYCLIRFLIKQLCTRKVKIYVSKKSKKCHNLSGINVQLCRILINTMYFICTCGFLNIHLNVNVIDKYNFLLYFIGLIVYLLLITMNIKNKHNFKIVNWIPIFFVFTVLIFYSFLIRKLIINHNINNYLNNN